MIRITLTDDEVQEATRVGKERRQDSRRRGFNKNIHAKKSTLMMDIDGAGAELAVARYLNLPFTGAVGTMKAPDVGSFQVRQTVYPNGHLIIRDNDPEDEQYIFVTGTCADGFSIIGWVWGFEAKMQDRRPDDEHGVSCWWIAQNCLRPLEELSVYVEAIAV